jgi:hypothetical protein
LKRPAPLTWIDARWSILPGGGLHFVMPVPEAVNHATEKSRFGVRRSKKSQANHVAAPLNLRHVPMFTGPCIAYVGWVRARAIGDTDGRLKQPLDLLNGIAYRDDACIEHCSIFRVDDPSEAPRCEVIVFPAGRAPRMGDLFAAYQLAILADRKAA